MDSETGEKLRDMETGEMPAKPKLNRETGEAEINFSQPLCHHRKTFKIPNVYIKNYPKVAHDVLTRLPVNNNRMSPVILFLLPTVVFLPIIAIFLGIIEIVLHIWAHKKNKYLRNKDIYYQSPLHVIVSEFCACCIDESMKNKISEMQDKRNNRFTKNSAEYFRRVVT